MVLHLQRLAGNKAVAALFAGRPAKAQPVASHRLSLQRCGTHQCEGSCSADEINERFQNAPQGDLPVQRQAAPPAACAYEAGERTRGTSGAGVLTHDVQLFGALGSSYSASGDSVVIGDFAPDSAKLTASTISDLEASWIKILESQTSQHYEILGFTDCVGDPARNSGLRDRRAHAVARLLPETAKRAATVGGAAAGDFLMENAAPDARAWNRSVILKLPAEPSPRKPVPPKPPDNSTITKRAPAATKFCTPGQRDQLSIAFPGARRMAETALSVLADVSRLNGVQKRALELYFGRGWYKHIGDIRAGYLQILAGWKDWDEHAQCHLDSEGACPSDDPGKVKLAYVWNKGLFKKRSYGDVHACRAAFALGDEELSATILHELSHRLDNTDDHKYCWASAGYCEGLSTEEAIDNADSYAEFARQVWNFSP